MPRAPARSHLYVTNSVLPTTTNAASSGSYKTSGAYKTGPPALRPASRRIQISNVQRAYVSGRWPPLRSANVRSRPSLAACGVSTRQSPCRRSTGAEAPRTVRPQEPGAAVRVPQDAIEWPYRRPPRSDCSLTSKVCHDDEFKSMVRCTKSRNLLLWYYQTVAAEGSHRSTCPHWLNGTRKCAAAAVARTR